jgi:arylsulfatase A-like enzyme
MELLNMANSNILVFMTDQQRASSVYGPNKAVTPNLDKFRKQSLSLTQVHCPSPHCCPSRATFFTGLYPSRHGIWNNVQVGNALSRDLTPGTRLWSEDLKDAGYDLYYFGKWHVSAVQGPKDKGWTEHTVTAGPPDGKRPNTYEWGRYISESLCTERNEATRAEGEIQRPGYNRYVNYGIHEDKCNDGLHTRGAAKLLGELKDSTKPWAMYVGPLGPHDPYMAPQRFVDMYNLDDIQLPESFTDTMEDKPALYRRTRSMFDQLTEREHKESIRHYLAYCSFEDELFGHVLDALDASGHAQNTMVLYCSDHGDYNAEHGLWCKGLPCFKSAYHVPAIIRWPGQLAPGVQGSDVGAFVSLADFHPTFMEVAGLTAPTDIYGKSLMPFLKGQSPTDWRDAIFTQSNGNEQYGIQRSVMTDKWHLVYNGYDFDELYDMQNDPHQITNLATKPEYEPVKRELYEQLWQFAYEQQDVCINPYIMVGLAAYGPGVARGLHQPVTQ